MISSLRGTAGDSVSHGACRGTGEHIKQTRGEARLREVRVNAKVREVDDVMVDLGVGAAVEFDREFF